LFHENLFLFFVYCYDSLCCPNIAANDPAAWRSGGVSISDYAIQRDVFNLLEGSAETSSHCAKPQVMGSVLKH